MLEFLYSIKCFFVGHDWTGENGWMCDRCLKLDFTYANAEIKRRHNEALMQFAKNVAKHWLSLSETERQHFLKQKPRN